MSIIVAALTAVLEVARQVVQSLVHFVWDDIVSPLLEAVFSLFGVVDETVVDSHKVSIPIFDVDGDTLVRDAIVRAVIKKTKTNTSFFPNYMQEMYKTKEQVRKFYGYAKNGDYIHGLPSLDITGVRFTGSQFAIVTAATDAYAGVATSNVEVRSGFDTPSEHFKFLLQDSHQYKPYSNTLTFTDSTTNSYNDWILLGEPVYNVSTVNYTLNIQRAAQAAKFWIEGPAMVTESNTATFTIKCNRTVPTGNTITVNLGYSGTAVHGTNYTQVSSVVIAASTDQVSVDIATANLSTGQPSSQFTVSIASVPNTGGVFQAIVLDAPNSVTCTIASDDALVITTRDILVSETGTATVQFKLEQAATGAFTVDYTFTDISTVGGVDYNNTTGTLNFTGAAGQVVNVLIPITGDVLDDDNEQFKVGLTNCSDSTVDISRYSTVTIQDGTDVHSLTLLGVGATITGDNFTPERTLVAKYHLNTETAAEWYYWLYKYSDETLSIDVDSQKISGLEVLPVAVLAKNGVFCDVDKNAELYTTTKKLVQMLGMNVDDLITNIKASPSIASISDAYLNFSAAPATVNKVVSKLIYISFHELVVTNGLHSETGEYTASFTEGDVNNALAWSKHDYTTGIVGVVADVGNYLHTPEYVPATSGSNGTPAGSILYLYCQDTTTTYSLIRVYNMNVMSAVEYTGYHQVAGFRLFNDGGTSVNTNLTIPISWAMFAKLSGEEQVGIYPYLCRIDLYSLTVTELAWYETAAFASAFQIIMILVAIVTLGQSLFVNSAFVGLQAASLVIAESLLVGYAVGELVVFVAESTGSAILAGVAGLIASVVAGGGELDFAAVISPENIQRTVTNFASDMASGQSSILSEKIQELIAEGVTIENARAQLHNEKNESPITAEFLNTLKSLEAHIITAIDLQYQFDATFGYAKVDEYYSNILKTEIV